MKTKTSLLLKQDQAKVKNSSHSSKLLRYQLLCVPHKHGDAYYIHIRMGKEHCTLPLPTRQREDALVKFDQLVRGTVTPCTLPDILDDMK